MHFAAQPVRPALHTALVSGREGDELVRGGVAFEPPPPEGAAGEVADVHVDQAGEPAVGGVLLEVDRRCDADREGEHDHEDPDPEGATEALEHPGLVRSGASGVGEEVAESRSQDRRTIGDHVVDQHTEHEQ